MKSFTQSILATFASGIAVIVLVTLLVQATSLKHQQVYIDPSILQLGRVINQRR